MEKGLLGGHGSLWGFLVPRRALTWLKKWFCYEARLLDGKGLAVWFPHMETRLLGWDRPSTGVLVPWESPYVTFGHARSSLDGNKAFLGGKPPLWGFLVARRAFSGSAIGSLHGDKAFWVGKGFYGEAWSQAEPSRGSRSGADTGSLYGSKAVWMGKGFAGASWPQEEPLGGSRSGFGIGSLKGNKAVWLGKAFHFHGASWSQGEPLRDLWF